jgi:hypothetical protein
MTENERICLIAFIQAYPAWARKRFEVTNLYHGSSIYIRCFPKGSSNSVIVYTFKWKTTQFVGTGLQYGENDNPDGYEDNPHLPV